jgi:membrane protease YdiL (CAAX protease family)
MENPAPKPNPPHCILLRRARRKMRNAAIASWIFAAAHLGYAQYMKYSQECQANMRSQEFCQIAIQVLVIIAVYLLILGLGAFLRIEISARLLPLYSATVVFLVAFGFISTFIHSLANESFKINLIDLLALITIGSVYGSHLYFAYHGLEGTFAYQDLIRENEHNQ